MSLILYHNEAQKELAQRSVIQQSLKNCSELLTVVRPSNTFYPAEE